MGLFDFLKSNAEDDRHKLQNIIRAMRVRKYLIGLMLALLVGCSSDSKSQPKQQSEIVYVTRTGEKYHRTTCTYLSKSKKAMPKDDAISAGYTACSKCRP